jgi:plasmid stabilization system protein ParE
MSPPLPVRVVNSAARAIAEAADWWAANRPKAPDAFVTDLESALQLIASHPGIGARAAKSFVFPMLDNGYIYLADVRLSIFRDPKRWL